MLLNACLKNNHASEMFARVICMQMGTKSEICLYPMTGKQMKETSVHHTVTLAYEIGKSIGDARDKGTDPLEGIVEYFKNSFSTVILNKAVCHLNFIAKCFIKIIKFIH